MQILLGLAEDGLKLLLELPSNSINNTQRLQVLKSAFEAQLKMGINVGFVKVCTDVDNTADYISISLRYPSKLLIQFQLVR